MKNVEDTIRNIAKAVASKLYDMDVIETKSLRDITADKLYDEVLKNMLTPLLEPKDIKQFLPSGEEVADEMFKRYYASNAPSWFESYATEPTDEWRAMEFQSAVRWAIEFTEKKYKKSDEKI